MFHFDQFFYSIINEVMDYHVNYTGENNLLIQLLYLYEFLLQLAVNMFLEREKMSEHTITVYLSVIATTLLMIIVPVIPYIELLERRRKKQNDIAGINVFYIPFLLKRQTSLQSNIL